LIKGFLDRVATTLRPDESVMDAYNRYEEEMSERELATFTKEVNIEDNVLREQVSTYEYSNLINQKSTSHINGWVRSVFSV